MTTFTQLPLHLPILLSRSLTGCGWPWPPTWPASRAPPASTRNLISAVTWPGAPSEAWTRWPPGGPHLELYIRWMQEIRRFRPSTVSRRFSVVAGFYRTCVLDGILEHSPAEHVRLPAVPAESPTLGFTHLQFEALLSAARESPNPCDFALVAMLGLLGLRIFEATGSDIADLGEEHGHRVLRVCGEGTKVVLVPLPPAAGRAIDRAIGTARAGRSCSTAMVPGWTGMRPPAACTSSPRPPESASPGPTPICSDSRHDHARRRRRPQGRPDRPRHADPRTTMRYDRARQNLDRHPNYVLAAYMASGT